MFTFPVIRINLRFWINHTVSEIHISGGHETYGIVEKIMLFRARKVATIFIEVCKWYDRICVTHLSLYPGSGAILEHTCLASPARVFFSVSLARTTRRVGDTTTHGCSRIPRIPG